MSGASPYQRYVETQVNTLTPAGLVVAAYDAAIRFAETALRKMEVHKLDEQSANIIKAQHILLELLASLDPIYDPKLAAGLDGLYRYMFDRLTHANVRDDRAALEEVIRLLKELRAAWAEAAASLKTKTAETGERAA